MSGPRDPVHTAANLANRFDLPFWITPQADGFMAMGFDRIVGLPSLRVKGMYLAIGAISLIRSRKRGGFIAIRDKVSPPRSSASTRTATSSWLSGSRLSTPAWRG
jgi:hypothetical protein